MKHLSRVLLALVLAASAGCASLLATVVKMVAPPAPATTSLADVLVTPSLQSHLEPTELGTISQSMFAGWKTGGDMTALMFSKKNAPGFLKIDGTVTVNGMPAEYSVAGVYTVGSAHDQGPRNVVVTTRTGEKASFTLTPFPETLRIVSLNGQAANASLDLTKDVVATLSGVPDGARLKVSLAVNQLGVKSFYDVCYVRAAAQVTIPAACFRNMNLKPGAPLTFDYGGSYLTVTQESAEQATAVSGAFSSVEYVRTSGDGMFVTVAPPPALNPGLTAKGTQKEFTYEAFKPGAFLSRPSEQLRRIGLQSLSIRGTTYHQSSKTTETSTAYITTTTTLQFPQQSDATWDALLEELYPAFLDVLKAEYGATEIPVDTVTASSAYQSTVALAKDDSNTTVNFSRSFRKTKVVSAFIPVGEGYGANSIEQRVMNEVGADALATLTLDLQISAGADNKILMTPRLAWAIAGKSNGPNASTRYITGTAVSEKGVPFTKDITPDQLRAIVRKSDLVAVFAHALHEVHAQEKASGDYTTVWALQ